MRSARPFLALLLLTTALPAAAEDIDKRVGRLESELKAVQRKVFPGGNGKYFEPEIAPAQPAAEPVGTPATSPVADLTTRVDGLERQLATITGQIEQANYKARQVEEALAKFRADAEFRMTQLEGGGAAPAAAAATAAPLAEDGALAAAPIVKSPKPKPAAPVVKSPKPAPAADEPRLPAPKAADLAAEPPATTADAATPPADPVEAEFQAAYSLYQNKRYGESEAALAQFVAKHPKSPRASHAQYWLGRAFLSDKQPAQAAKAFLDNYRNMPKGARAPDSLLFLGQSLMTITPPNPAKACEVYDELKSAYATRLTPALTTQLTKARATAKCAT